MSKPTLLIVGAGGRGRSYAKHTLRFPGSAQVVGFAEPRDDNHQQMVDLFKPDASRVFRDWREAASKPRFADAAVICTQDAMHAEPAIAFLRRGYHVLLEKPMAPNPDDCIRIAREARAADRIFAVCHVLRYTDSTTRLRQIIADGAIGQVISIQRLEPVGHWHQAHSFVRGNWGNTARSSCMLLAKSCHDIDWLTYMMGRPCRQVHSFGELTHFRREAKPAEAGDATRCLDCAYEPQCPYSAVDIYLDRARAGNFGWPVGVITSSESVDAVERALRDGPYGRCVYECDNDVVDHQVVNMSFEGGLTASFVMTAFTRTRGRETHIFGTRGELICDDRIIEHHDFLTGRTERIDTAATDAGLLGGHGGGDTRLMQAFIEALANDDPSLIRSGPETTLESHLAVFAAEQSRREGRVVDVPDVRAMLGDRSAPVTR